MYQATLWDKSTQEAMMNFLTLKAYFFRVIKAYPLGFSVLSLWVAYVLWGVCTRFPVPLVWYFVFVFCVSLVVDTLTHKIRVRDRVARVGVGAIVVVLVALVVYHTIFKYGFSLQTLESEYARIDSKRYMYYYLGITAVGFGVFAYVVLRDLERFVRFVGQICVSVLLWALGLGLLGLIYASAHMLDLDKMAFFSKFWEVPAPIILCLYAYGLSVRLLGILINRSGSNTSARPLATILLWVFNIFAFAYVALLVIYALSPQKYFDGVVHLVLWFGVFLILLAWSNVLSDKSKIALIFLAIACVLESVAIWAIGVRIGEYGFTPNRIFVLLAGVFFVFVALTHIILESGILESKDTESKHKSQNLIRTIAIAFVLCFGIGGFAAPSVSIHSQLTRLESLHNNLKNATTLDERYEIIDHYNSALDVLEEFGQGGGRQRLSKNYMAEFPPSMLQDSAKDNEPQRTSRRYDFGFLKSQSIGLYSYIDVMFGIEYLRESCWEDKGYNDGFLYRDNYAFRICEDTLMIYDVRTANDKTTLKLLFDMPDFSQTIIRAYNDNMRLVGFVDKKRIFELILVLDDVIVEIEHDPKSNTNKQWIKNLSATAFITTQAD